MDGLAASRIARSIAYEGGINHGVRTIRSTLWWYMDHQLCAATSFQSMMRHEQYDDSWSQIDLCSVTHDHADHNNVCNHVIPWIAQSGICQLWHINVMITTILCEVRSISDSDIPWWLGCSMRDSPCDMQITRFIMLLTSLCRLHDWYSLF